MRPGRLQKLTARLIGADAPRVIAAITLVIARRLLINVLCTVD